MKRNWVYFLLLTLVFEKIIQHIFVTLAFAFDWAQIRSTVAVNPDFLMVAGGVVVLLFALALWGLVKERGWATNLVIGLALFDIIGEFVAQGTLGIMLNVSFIVATVLLVLGVLHRRQAAKAAPASLDY